MITKEQFLKGLQIQRDRQIFIDTLYDLGINTIDAEDKFDELYSLYIETNFTEEGQDWYSWYLYEKPDVEEPSAWEADGSPISLSNDEELWDFMVTNNYLR